MSGSVSDVLAYRQPLEAGGRGRPAVVVLHGMMGHPVEWDELVTALAPERRVIVPDLRGHGDGERVEVYRVADMVADVVELLGSMGVARATLVGHSLGGMVAMTCAARHPDLVEGLVVLDVGPDAFDTDFAAGLGPFLDELGAAVYDRVDEAFELWSSGNPLAQPGPLRRYVEHALVRRGDGRWEWGFDAIGLRRSLGELATVGELWDAVDRVGVPTLVIRGRSSQVLSQTTAHEMARRLGDATLLELDAGHDLGVERPDEVAAAVASFLTTTAVHHPGAPS